MNILGIETSTLTGSVAFLADNHLKGETTLSVSVQHSERLMPAIDELLKNVGAQASDIDLIAVSHGPGSFTGLRIGSAVAQGLAASLGKPVIGVSTLKALAMNAIGFNGVIVAALNAFRGELYWAGYKTRDDSLGLETIWPETTVRPDQAIETLREIQPLFLLGNGCEFLSNLNAVYAPSPIQSPRASYVALLASEAFKKGDFAPSSYLPQYHRSIV